MEYQEASSATFSKKLKSSYSFSGKSIYDGVFGGTAKVASRVVEDYGEIFGGSGGPSVPVLDVPELNERKVSVDVSSAKLDYPKIFGGFGEFDFGVSHEKLAAAKPNKRESFVQEARTPAETISHASNVSIKNQLFSHETSYQSLNGVKQFKTSFSKTNQGRKSGTNGKTHIAQLHAVPGYTCLINEAAPSQMSEVDKPLPSVSNCNYHNTNFSGEIMQGIASRKAMSTHPPGVARKQPSTDGIKFKIKSNSGRSNSIDMSFDAYEIGIGTQTSRVQLPSNQSHGLSNNKGASEIPVASKSEVSKGHSSGICSPPYFDDEVDVNSVAAASAAAVKKAIEEAQARIRIAKAINERKKEGRNHVKLIFKNGSKVEERKEAKVADKVNKFQDEACEKYGKADKPMPVAVLGTQNAVKADQVAPDFRERDKLFSAKRASSGMHANENKTTQVDPRWEEMKDWKSERQGDIGAKLMQLVNEREVKEQSFANKRFEKPEKNVEKLEFVEEAHNQEKIERKLNVMEGACGMKEFADKSNSDQEVHGVEEYEKRSMVGLPEEMEVTFTASLRIEYSGEKLRSIEEPSEKKLEMLDVEDNEYMEMRIQTDEHEWLKNGQKLKETFKQEENDTRSEDVLEKDENEVGLKEIFHHKEKGERDELACKRVELDKQQKEACTAEESEVGQIDVHGRKEVEETSDKTEGQQKINGQKSEKKLDEDSELVAQENFIGAEENVKTLEEVYEMIEIEKRREENSEWAQAGNVRAGIDQRAENENTITQEALQHWKNNLEAAYDVCKQDENETLSEILEVSGDQENNECLGTPTNEENEEVMEVTEDSSEWKEIDTESNAVELANELEEKEVSEVKMTGMAQVTLDLNEIKKQVQGTTKAFSFDYTRVDLRTMETNVPPTQNDLHGKESGIPSVADKHDEEFTRELEEIFEDAEEVEVAMELEENESNFELSHEENSFDNWKNSEATHPPGMFQEEEESAEISHKIETSTNIEKRGENYSKALKTEEREAKGSSQKQVELEKDDVQKIDKEKEKEREREKERTAVERAIREARERAFTEARERAEKAAAEKANAEARRRAVAEARERLEKTSAETNGKSSADKTYMEARLKAERAAVQRATAEARERALERAMSEKAALGTRNQAVKSSGASRDTGIRQNYASNDSQPRGSGPTRSLGNPNSFNNGVNGESIQRDKASLERDKRTAERAAKALAEKNMRDLLAQKEQAERNRLAEALDADVKRWSSGKAGNLRALLSTLQFILGPDSGWEPIRLTDLLTSTAVKKAYRKATLFVHPDKLQQRGASIQQKYICEKVFDLLKEAWNKFSGEER